MRHTVQIDLSPSGSNAITTSGANLGGEKTGGYVIRAAVAVPTGTPPHGRYYAQIVLCRSPTYSVGDTIAILWSGYVTGYEPASIPNCRIGLGEWAFLVVTAGTNGATTDVIRAFLTVSPDPAGASWIFTEAPGSGPGEIFTQLPGNPGAGADVTTTVPANVHRRLRCFRAIFTAAAVAVTRYLHITALALGTANAYKLDQPYGAGVTTGVAVTVVAALGGDYQAVIGDPTVPTATMPLPDVILISTDKLGTLTTSENAGDQWSGVKITVEEWAVPNP